MNNFTNIPILKLNDDFVQLLYHHSYRSMLCIYIGRNWLIFLDSLNLDAGFLPTNTTISLSSILVSTASSQR